MTVLRFKIALYFILLDPYIFLPLDILPEMIFGIVGYIEELVLALIVTIYISDLLRVPGVAKQYYKSPCSHRLDEALLKI